MGDVEYAVVSITPGELLKEEFLEPMGITQYRLAKEIGVPAGRIGQIVAGKRAITADTDLRLCKFFGPVSYTHLDVYKRQRVHPVPRRAVPV